MNMNKNSGERQPKFEIPMSSEGQEALAEKAVEAGVQEESSTGRSQSQMQQNTVTQPAISIPVVVAQPQTDDKAPTPTKGLEAAEADLIEKQWVERAKAIVSQTKSDPYSQKREISRAGADYIKKRFNKTIPTDDAVRQ